MLDPASLASLLPGLLGGGGTEVNQSVSNSSQSGISLSISNILPGGTAGNTVASQPQNANPVSSVDPTPASSPSYGAFPDTSLLTSALGAGQTPPAQVGGGLTGNPVLIGGVALLATLAVLSMFKGRRRKR